MPALRAIGLGLDKGRRILRWRAPLVLAGLLAMVLETGSAAQQPVFRTGTDVVGFGVTVTDRRGNFITDLKPDDLEILEEGRAAGASSCSPAETKPRPRRNCTSGWSSIPAAAWGTTSRWPGPPRSSS